MDAKTLGFFQREVEKQCEFALIAAHDLEGAVKNRIDIDRTWYSAQAFLVAVANVSKLLWGTNSAARKRREELRRSLSIEDESPLAPPRTLRDHFEHFDERLECWLASSKRRNFIDSNIMPANYMPRSDQIDHLRHLDPDTFTLTFWGDTYDLPPVVKVVHALRERADTACRASLGLPARCPGHEPPPMS